MSMTAQELYELALKLPPEERVKLAELLDRSVPTDPASPEPLSPEWQAEIERRVARIESGEAGRGIPADEAMADARRKLEEHRKNKQRGKARPA